MASLIVVPRGAAPWAGPGWIAVEVPGVPGSYYQVPDGRILDGATGADRGWYAVPDNSAASGRTAAELNRLALGQPPPPLPTSTHTVLHTPGASPAASAAPSTAPGGCPAFVAGASYRATDGPTRYVFLDGQLHRIPDPETAAAHGWTNWTDVAPSCVAGAAVGAAIPSVRPGAGPMDWLTDPANRTTLLVAGGGVLALLVLSGGRRRR